MKIELISYRHNLKSEIKRDLSLSLINTSESDLILFPGHAINDKKDLLFLRDKIENSKPIVFLELKEIGARKISNWCFKIEDGELINCSTHQLFATSKEINNNPFCAENLYSEIKLKRIHNWKGKTVCLLLCGEFNILTNIQNDKNKVEIRVENPELKKNYEKLFDEVDIFLNPMHTPMGNQGKMHMRRKYLSKKKRAYFSTSNLVRNAREAKGAFQRLKSLQYAYYNGSEISPVLVDNDKNFLKTIFEIND